MGDDERAAVIVGQKWQRLDELVAHTRSRPEQIGQAWPGRSDHKR
jgi:hypothetical protein